MMQLRSFFIIILISSVTLFAERIDLQSYASGFDSIPIAVIKFSSLNNVGLTTNQPWEIIADDLEFGGRFFVTRSAKSDSAEFSEKNIGIFIYGEYSVNGNTIVMDCNLYDATSMDLLFGKKYRGELKFLRTMVHRFTNKIYDMLLGERGPFESKILFVKDKGNTKHLHIMDYDGYNRKKLTSRGQVNVFPAFIDSNSIVWTSFLRGKPDIYTGSISTGSFSIFVYSRYVETSPASSSIHDKIVYASSCAGNLDIYTCNRNGKNRKKLTFKRSIDTSPCWSPNGYHISFTSDRSGQPQIYVMDSDGVNTRRITFEGSYQDSPAWSPKGDKIAYSSLRNGKFDIWIINPDGTAPSQVTSLPGNNEYPTWSPDASHIAFVSTRGGKSNIYRIRPDGTGIKQITRSGNAKMPDWSKL
jgi:TolB protein